MNIQSKTTIETTGYVSYNILKNHNGDIGDWYGQDIVKELDFNSEIKEIGLPNGEYKITITFERLK